MSSPGGGVKNINISLCERGVQLLRRYPGVLCDPADCYVPDLSWSSIPGEGFNSLKFPPFVHYLCTAD